MTAKQHLEQHDEQIAAIRASTDTTVVKAARAKQFLAGYDPKCKALEDYEQSTDLLLKHLQPKMHDVTTEATA
jgi:hypothetical protein